VPLLGFQILALPESVNKKCKLGQGHRLRGIRVELERRKRISFVTLLRHGTVQVNAIATRDVLCCLEEIMNHLLLAMISVLFLFLASCSPKSKDSPKPKDSIVGKWEDEDGTSLVVEFTKDGVMTLTDRKNEPISGKYTIAGEDQINVDDAASKLPKMTCKADVTANDLTLSDFRSETRLVAFHEGKLLYSFPPGGEEGKRRNQIKFKRVK